jgi:hypothetical protein
MTFNKANPGREKGPPPFCHPCGKNGGRGLCKGCYQAAWGVVKVGLFTWEELEKLGKCYPLRKV